MSDPAAPRAPSPIAWPVALLVAVALALATAAAFRDVRGFPFTNYDDPGYVTANPEVQAGLTAASVRWAFTTGAMSNWQPLAWLSHMLDVELFGLDGGRHHLTSLALHVANVVVLFGFLADATGRPARSAVVAALFALHPAHVESVAWVAERKDVLSTLFGLLALWAHVRRARRPTRSGGALVAVLLAFGLMAKPMVVTLPIVMLLLDVWPLRRLAAPAGGAPRRWRRLLGEKLPLFALAGAACAVTLVAQHAAGAVRSTTEVPLAARAENAVVAYLAYLEMLAWPAGLACFYPLRLPLPPARVAWSAAFLVVLAAGVVRVAARRPYVPVGALWYVVMLAPVIGLLQVGPQAMADRYTYLAAVGVFVVVVWGTADLVPASPLRRPALAAAAALALGACFVLTRGQVSYWRSSRTLFEHAIAVTGPNHIAQVSLGMALADDGRDGDAVAHYREALRIVPRYPEALQLLADALERTGAADEALGRYRELADLTPRDARAQVALGMALRRRGDGAAAEARFADALRLDPASAPAHAASGLALADDGRLDDAVRELDEAVRLDPGFVDARYDRGLVRLRAGRLDEAIADFEAVLRRDPRQPEAQANLGVALDRAGRLDEAIARYSDALRLDPGLLDAYRNRAAAYRRKGDVAAAEADEARAAGAGR